MLRFAEPPSADPHARWCGGRDGQPSRLPDVRLAWRFTCRVKVPCTRTKVLKEGSIPTVTPIDKVLETCNRGRVTDCGKEATSQSCEVTDRNSIQGRWGQVSEPTIAKPSSFVRIGKSSACAAKVYRLIQGELEPVSGSRLYAESRSRAVKAVRRLQQSAEAVVRTRHTPLAIGRAEP